MALLGLVTVPEHIGRVPPASPKLLVHGFAFSDAARLRLREALQLRTLDLYIPSMIGIRIDFDLPHRLALLEVDLVRLDVDDAIIDAVVGLRLRSTIQSQVILVFLQGVHCALIE